MVDNGLVGSGTGEALSNLAPAIIMTFGTIILGYILGRIRVVNDEMVAGISKFTAAIALPALLFNAMATIELGDVEWDFVIAVLIAKSICFFTTCFATLALNYKSPAKYTQAGIRSIFTSQSNDLAFGLPIIQSLFGVTNPTYAQNIFVVAPISLIILNPIGYCLMEYGRGVVASHSADSAVLEKEAEDASKKRAAPETVPFSKIILKVLLGVVLNPIVFMTFFGLLGNVAFNHTVPSFLSGLLDSLGNAFAATALFCLGYSMVGKFEKFEKRNVLMLSVLVLMQGLLMPILVKLFIDLQDGGACLGQFGFIYGTLPTAPTLYVFAKNMGGAAATPEIIAMGVVISTILACPVLFFSASLLSRTASSNGAMWLTSSTLDIGYPSLLLAAFLLILFLLSKHHARVRNILFRPVAFLVFSQFALPLCSSFCWVEVSSLGEKVRFGFIFFWMLATWSWAAAVAVVMVIVIRMGVRVAHRWFYAIQAVAWLVPALSTALLLITHPTPVQGPFNSSNGYCWLIYGAPQFLATALVALFLMIVTITALVLFFRRLSSVQHAAHTASVRTYNAAQADDVLMSDDETAALLGTAGNINNGSDEQGNRRVKRREGRRVTMAEEGDSMVTVSMDDQMEQRGQSKTRSDEDDLSDDEDVSEDADLTHLSQGTGDGLQLRLVAVAVYGVIAMAIAFLDSIWNFTSAATMISGVQLEIQFFHYAFVFGGGLASFFVFGLQSSLSRPISIYLRSINSRFRHWLYDTEVIEMPGLDWGTAVLEDISTDCQTFLPLRAQCEADIARTYKYRLRRYKMVFLGKSLVDWLIEKGVCRDRVDAVRFGQNLIRGGLLHHVHYEHHFHDSSYFYKISPLPSEDFAGAPPSASSYDYAQLLHRDVSLYGDTTPSESVASSSHSGSTPL